MQLLGKKYLVEHCIYAYNRRQKELAYKYYVTDILRAMANMEAKGLTRDNSIEVVSKRFADIFSRKKEDSRTGEEIAADIIKRAGLSFGE